MFPLWAGSRGNTFRNPIHTCEQLNLWDEHFSEETTVTKLRVKTAIKRLLLLLR